MGLIQSFVQRHEQTHEARYRRIWNRKGRSQVLWVDWIFSRLDFSSFRGEKILPFGLKLVKKIVFPSKLNYWSCEKHLHLDDNISHEWKSASKIAQKLSFLKIELLNREILVDNFGDKLHLKNCLSLKSNISSAWSVEKKLFIFWW